MIGFGAQAEAQPTEKVGARLRSLMCWKEKTKSSCPLPLQPALPSAKLAAIFWQNSYLYCSRPIISMLLLVVGKGPSNFVHRIGMPEAMVFT